MQFGDPSIDRLKLIEDMRLAAWVLHGQKTLPYLLLACHKYVFLRGRFSPLSFSSFGCVFSYLDFTLELMNTIFYTIKRNQAWVLTVVWYLGSRVVVSWFIDDLSIKLSFYECNVFVNYNCGIIRISKSKLSLVFYVINISMPL